MVREYSTVIGSGTIPHLQTSPPYNLTAGSFPIPDQRSALRVRSGDGSVILNPEDFSVAIGLRQQAVVLTGSSAKLPSSSLENRRALVIHNNGVGTLYIGTSNVTTLNGFPILSGEKIAIDIQGNPNVEIWGISASSSDVRILELA
jgi:hypothetical protein